MALRKSLLRQQIQRTLKPAQSPWLIALGVLASQPVTPLHAAENHYEWSCRPAASGQGWDCQEQVAPGVRYTRPAHSTRRGEKTVAATGSAALPADKPRYLPAAQVDWVDSSLLSETQREAAAPACCGSYIEPERTDADAQLNPADAPLRATADSSEMVQETTTTLQGDVKLTQGYRQLEADKATLDQTGNTAVLEGNIRLREPGMLVTGSQANLNIDTGEALITDASYLLHQVGARGDASTLEHDANKVLILEDGTFTRCEPDSNTWYLKGSELKIDPNTQQGYGKHVRLNIKGIPVFYTPYLQFPAGGQRMSGFLFPSISSSDGGGVDVAVPYYFNLAPNYDMTLTPRFISDRGEMLEAEFRHMSENFKTTVSTGHLSSDDGGDDSDLQDMIDDGLISEDVARPYKGEDRWLLGVDQIGGLSSRWSSRIDYTSVSDIDYFRDLDTASLQVNSTTHLKKSGQLGYRGDHWNYQLKVEEYQTIAKDTSSPYKQLPRINVDGNYRLGDNWLVELDNEYVNFDHRNVDDENILTGERTRLDYSVSWDKQWAWGYVKPSAMIKSLNYQFDDEYLKMGANDSPSFTVPQGSLDMGLFFERDGALRGNHYIQTFEPRLFYFYSDYENQDDLINLTTGNSNVDFDTGELTFSYNQLFRDTRFSGGDRIGDDHRLSVGLTTRFIDPDSGIERFSASLGQIIYFDDRAVNLTQTTAQALADADNLENNSELAAQFSAQVGDHWQFRSDIMWDEGDNNKVSRGNATLRYRDDQYRLFNLGYRYSRKDFTKDIFDIDNDLDTTELTIDQSIEQGDISFSWPIAGNWSAVGRANYDFTNNRELETLAGVEYNSCCYRLRLVARKWLDNDLINVIDDSDLEEDQGIFFEFQLKGLGGIGSKVTGILNDGIYGYEDRELQLK